MSVKKEAVEVRKRLVDRLRYEMVGPSSEKELISGKPLQKYLAGILWPMKSNIVKTEDESDVMQGKDADKETIESVAPLANAMNPSAIGMSFLVDIGSPLLAVDISLGMYIEKGDRVWERVPYGLTKETINLSEKIGIKRIKEIPKLDIHNDVQTQGAVQLEWITRRYNNCYAVSMFIVNRHTQETDEHDVDSKCLFQPKITIESLESPSIMVRNAFSNNEKGFQDEDTKTNELLYRNESAYGVGHSIAVYWSKVDKHQKKAGRLETEVIPAYEIPMVIPPSWNQGGTLDMKELGNMHTATEVERSLLPLLEAYGKWIEGRKGEIDDLEDHKETAKQHMEKCDASLKRMYEGLAVLKENENAFASFIFANQVMSNQRAHTVVAEGGSERIEDVESKWRPFQIAFFLQNLKGTVDPTSKDRQIADLLWFPTGGGKTEAYLGLAAFTLGYRRLTCLSDFRTDVGVSVIMRYTLRLLTVQQFQRATAMICACEEIRRSNPDKWGTRPYRIGLWVGKASTPNNYDDAKKVIESKIKAGMNKSESINIDLSNGTPVQLVSCPWCGSKWARPRDISHYEEFYAYHAALYRYVEPISVTPFASRAIDRGMAAVLVSMIRLNNPEFTSDGSASKPVEHEGLFEEVTKVFLERAKKMGLTQAAIQKELDKLTEAWENDADRSKLNYNNSSKSETETNLLYPIGSSKKRGTFKTPNSMRDVEPTAGIYIKK